MRPIYLLLLLVIAGVALCFWFWPVGVAVLGAVALVFVLAWGTVRQEVPREIAEEDEEL